MGQGVVEGEIADLDVREGGVAGAIGERRGSLATLVALQGSGAVLRQDVELVLAEQPRMRGDQGAAMDNADLPVGRLDLCSRKLGCPITGTKCGRSSAKRSSGGTWVVPWMRGSAMVAFHSSSWAWKSTMSRKRRPGMKLRLTYFTPDSTLPLVWAR